MLTAAIIEPLPKNPFPGLRYFTADETHLFFGRDGQTDELVRKLERSRFVGVTGSSGSGKSSLVRAGLLPSLCAGYLVDAGLRWGYADLRPRNSPIQNLSQALLTAGLPGLDPDALRADPRAIAEAVKKNPAWAGRNLLILVDQFEELFRFTARHESATADRDEKDGFVHLLLEAATQREVSIYVVITLRSDFLGDCSQFRGLPEAINDSQYLVPRLTRDQRRMAIEGPIRVAGADITPRLVQRLLNEAGDDPDQLPVLQHALMRTWDQWQTQGQKRPIDFDDYEAIGTMEKGISQHADEALKEACGNVGQDGPTIAKRIFQRLSDRDSQGRETRRPSSIKELREVAETPSAALTEVVGCFRKEGRSFLTPFKGELTEDVEIDVTHECLLRKWSMLRDSWNRDEDESRRVYGRIASRAEDALIHDTKDSFSEFLHGAILERALEWWNERAPNKAWAERYHPSFDLARTFLLASKANRDKEVEAKERLRREEEQRKIAEARKEESAKVRETRWRVGLLLGLIIIAGCAALAWKFKEQSKKLSEQSNTAFVRMLAGQAAVASSDSDNLLRTSALLAAESLKRQPTLEAQVVLTKALSILLKPLPALGGKDSTDAEYSPDGNLIAIVKSDRVQLYEAQSGNWRADLDHSEVSALMFGGEYLATVGGRQVRIWDSVGGRLATLKCDHDIADVAVGSSGLKIAVSCGGVYLWTSTPGWRRPVRQVLAEPKTEDLIGNVAISQHEHRVAWQYGGSDPEIKIMDLPTQRTYSVKGSSTMEMGFDPLNPDMLITAESEGTLKSWSYTREVGPEASSILKLSSLIAEFSLDGNLVAVGGQDGSGKIWDTSGGIEVGRFILDVPIHTVALSKRAGQVAVVGKDRVVHRWSIQPQSTGIDLGSQVISARFSQSASTLVAVQADGGSIAETQGGRTQVEQGELLTLAVSGDSSLIARWGMANHPGILEVNELAGVVPGKNRFRIETPEHAIITGLTFSPDKRYLAGGLLRSGQSATEHNCLIIWNLEKKEPKILPGLVWTQDSEITFDPDSLSLFIANQKGLQRFAVDTGLGMPVEWEHHERFSKMRFSPDGHLVALIEVNKSDGASDAEDSTALASSVHLLEYPSGLEAAHLDRSGQVEQLGFSNDSNYLVTGSSDRTARLWDLRSKTEEARVPVPSRITAVALTPDLRIAIADQRHVTLNDWKAENLVDDLCKRLDRNLTRKEWERYAPAETPQLACPKLKDH